MTVIGLHSFNSQILNELYSSQNYTGNMAFSGIGLYLLLSAINFGLSGRSFSQLSNILGQNYHELFDTANWRNSERAYECLDRRYLAEEISSMNSVVFFSGDIFDYYKQISGLVCSLNHIKINDSDPEESACRLNKWISQTTFGSIWNMFDHSMMSENIMIFIHTLFFRADWKTKFNPALTKHELFYDDKCRPLKVAMMNQRSFYPIYDSIKDNFQILFKPLAHPYFLAAIVLPRVGHTIKDVLKSFKFNEMKNYFQNSSLKYADFKLPKFQVLSHADLVQPLTLFGITDIFERNHSGFGKMTYRNIAKIAVDELGLREIEFSRAIPEESISQQYLFHVRRPFLFFVYSSIDNHVFFSAIVTNPNEA
ncbi:Glia-derived nexin [Thelohanellus kitauei]|uniref:Glia-derived nexin n=1 Tax=Thelohanellus kitauei TaxID=669202 RepID=A0A0C2NBI4_THEKT|nr:Glia-derived nexin [Thelohanellus kitauei]